MDPGPQYCPFCDAELDLDDTTTVYDFKSKLYFISHYLYKCPNCEGFDTKEEAFEYEPPEESIITDITNINDLDWRDIVCESSTNYVCGGFYIWYKEPDILRHGYPF